MVLSELHVEDRRRVLDFLAGHRVQFAPSAVGGREKTYVATLAVHQPKLIEDAVSGAVTQVEELKKVRIETQFDPSHAYPLLAERQLMARSDSAHKKSGDTTIEEEERPSGSSAKRKSIADMNKATLLSKMAMPTRFPTDPKTSQIIVPDLVTEQYGAFVKLLFPPTKKISGMSLHTLSALISDIFDQRFSVEARKLKVGDFIGFFGKRARYSYLLLGIEGIGKE